MASVPIVPTGTFTRDPQVFSAGTAICSQQYDKYLSDLEWDALGDTQSALIAADVGAAADAAALVTAGILAATEGAAFAAMAAGLFADVPVVGTAAAAGVGATALSVAKFASIADIALQATGVASTIAGIAYDHAAFDHEVTAQQISDEIEGITGGSPGTHGTYTPNNDLPNCSDEYYGTQTIQAGGINVTDDSYFNGNVGIDGNLDVSQTVTANQVRAAQGISAHGGAIWLGDPSGDTYFSGITLGGGALAGAGCADPGACPELAYTGTESSIAIGNSASATGENGLALGTDAETHTGISIGAGAGEAGDAGVAIGHDSRAREATDTAVGHNSQVNAANGTAVGADTFIGSLSDNGVAIGQGTTIGVGNAVGADNVTAVGQNIDIADGVDNVVAVGQGASVTFDGGVAVGQLAAVSGTDSIAIGRSVTTDGSNAVGIGISADADGASSVAIGDNANAVDTRTIAVGALADATGTESIAIGDDANATNSWAIAIGDGANASGSESLAAGQNANSSNTASIALGNDTVSSGTWSIAVGNSSNATGESAVAIGGDSKATADWAFAGGYNANAAGISSIALGDRAEADDKRSMALGYESHAQGEESLASGAVAVANGLGSTAIGSRAYAVGDGAVALGYGAESKNVNSTSIGAGATTNRYEYSAAFGAGAEAIYDHHQVFGTVNESYTMPGLTSALSRQRQVGRLELPTTDGYGNLATDGGAVFSAIARAQAGIAIGYALSPPQLTADENFGIRAGVGNFDGDAVGFGVSAIGVFDRDLLRSGDRLAFTAGIGFGESEFLDYSGSGTVGASGGLQYTW